MDEYGENRSQIHETWAVVIWFEKEEQKRPIKQSLEKYVQGVKDEMCCIQLG